MGVHKTRELKLTITNKLEKVLIKQEVMEFSIDQTLLNQKFDETRSTCESINTLNIMQACSQAIHNSFK